MNPGVVGASHVSARNNPHRRAAGGNLSRRGMGNESNEMRSKSIRIWISGAMSLTCFLRASESNTLFVTKRSSIHPIRSNN